ncbi:MAG: sulfate ABC transporter substrate-binding protein [Planctomycetes bacterium]|nr:sulfate ABC transporter substrate-binding protein [Planctomycetota bacterium]
MIRILALVAAALVLHAADDTLLNVSYDPTRELYKEVNAAFAAQWKQAAGRSVEVKQSHGGSGKQTRSVIEGLDADIVTLALPMDADEIAKAGRLAADWRSRLPHNASPYTSTVVFLVRSGNPKGITDWGDLAKADVATVVANPKTSGAARLAYLGAWAWAERAFPGDSAKVEAYMRGWLARVPTFDPGARGATTTFVRRQIGDVLLTWENEAWLAVAESKGSVQVVVPPVSILAEPPVAWVDAVVAKKGTAAVAKAYLEFLYTPAAQEIAAKHRYRPRLPEVLERHRADFPAAELIAVEQAFGGWDKAQAAHFADGASFDRLTSNR